MIRTFAQLFDEVIKRPKQTLVVPAAENSAIISACAEAAARKICQIILIGDEKKIRQIAMEAN